MFSDITLLILGHVREQSIKNGGAVLLEVSLEPLENLNVVFERAPSARENVHEERTTSRKNES